MGKNIFRFILCVCVLAFGFSFTCFASDINSDVGINAIEENEMYDSQQESGQASEIDFEEDSTELSDTDGGTVLAEESETEEYLTFYPAEKIVSGEATLTDVYNVLAGIHNLFIIAIFITSAAVP